MSREISRTICAKFYEGIYDASVFVKRKHAVSQVQQRALHPSCKYVESLKIKALIIIDYNYDPSAELKSVKTNDKF